VTGALASDGTPSAVTLDPSKPAAGGATFGVGIVTTGVVGDAGAVGEAGVVTGGAEALESVRVPGVPPVGVVDVSPPPPPICTTPVEPVAVLSPLPPGPTGVDTVVPFTVVVGLVVGPDAWTAAVESPAELPPPT
jgi:hypothetical protein